MQLFSKLKNMHDINSKLSLIRYRSTCQNWQDHLAVSAPTVSIECLFVNGRDILAIRRQAMSTDTFRR